MMDADTHEGVTGVGEEKLREDKLGEETGRQLKLDRHGLPLSPQPTDNSDDPLNWPKWLKVAICLQVSWMAMLGPMGSAIVNPAFVPLSVAFDVTVVQASYELTVYIIFAGIGPVLFTPLAQVYGRRPIYLIATLIAGVTNVAAGYAQSWGGLLATRVFNGLAAGCPVAIGAATIADLFFLHERGFYLGIYIYGLTNGPHLAPLLGGFIAQYTSWSWCFQIPGFIQIGTAVVACFTLPETIYPRTLDTVHVHRSWMDLMVFRNTRLKDRKVRWADYARSFYMMKYVAVTLPGLYYMTSFAWFSVLFAVTGASLFTSIYHFQTYQTGLLLSIPLLIGSAIGESCAGWVTDHMVYVYAKKHNGYRKPEARIKAAVFALLGPIGLIIQGVCLSKKASWVGVAFGMGIANMGLQIASTTCYAYAIDAYKPQSAEISSMMNVFRQGFSFIVSFYAIPFGTRIGYEYAWLTLALINVLFWAAFMSMIRWGEGVRKKSWQKPPTFHTDL